MDVSICIPTKNGGEQFRQVLEAVFHQKTDFSYEVICVDSGSSDQTLEIIESYPQIKLHQIPPAEFGHGRTRNLAASLGTGEFIVFITQDAVPAHERWLDQMIKAIRQDDQIVLCFGAHYPYPDCNILDRRDITQHFQNFGSQNTVYHLDDPERYRTEEGYRHLLAFSSDNNACVRRSVFEQYPYPDAEFAEDQIWTRQMMEKGYSKVFCPFAAVYHSHNYPVGEYFHRYYDEYKGLRKIHDYKMVSSRGEIPSGAKRLFMSDVAYIRSLPMTYKQKAEWCWYALRRDINRYRAGYLGGSYQDRSAEKQKQMDRKYSQQYYQRNRKKVTAKDKDQPVKVWKYEELWRNTGVPMPGSTVSDPLIHVENIYGFVTDVREIPFVPSDYEKAKNSPLILNWVIPEPGKGSGGHLNIFRFVAALQQKGIRNRIYLQNASQFASNRELRKFVREYYPILPSDVELFYTCEGMPFCHGIVATGWSTAYFVRNFNNTISKFYFVQDFEPLFFPMGSEYKFAENTYRFGFRGITAGDWLKNKLEKEFHMPCDSFHFSYDKDLYAPVKKRDDRKRVFFYARPVTPRRAWELGLLALMELHCRIPDLEVVFAGWDVSNYAIPFVHRNAGTLALDQLADLYGQCDLCLVMSLTNLSLLPLEVMASGSVIATQEDENNSWMINRENSVIIDCDPVHIADVMADYLNHPEKLERLRQNGIQYALQTDWASETEKVYQSVTRGIKEDEEKL